MRSLSHCYTDGHATTSALQPPRHYHQGYFQEPARGRPSEADGQPCDKVTARVQFREIINCGDGGKHLDESHREFRGLSSCPQIVRSCNCYKQGTVHPGDKPLPGDSGLLLSPHVRSRLPPAQPATAFGLCLILHMVRRSRPASHMPVTCC